MAETPFNEIEKLDFKEVAPWVLIWIRYLFRTIHLSMVLLNRVERSDGKTDIRMNMFRIHFKNRGKDPPNLNKIKYVSRKNLTSNENYRDEYQKSM